MAASLLYYKKFVKKLKRTGFKLNPYDHWISNILVNYKHQPFASMWATEISTTKIAN